MKKNILSLMLLVAFAVKAEPIQYSIINNDGAPTNQGQTYDGDWKQSSQSVADAIKQGLPETLSEWKSQSGAALQLTNNNVDDFNKSNPILQLYPNSYHMTRVDGKSEIRPFLSVPIQFNKDGNIKQNGTITLKK